MISLWLGQRGQVNLHIYFPLLRLKIEYDDVLRILLDQADLIPRLCADTDEIGQRRIEVLCQVTGQICDRDEVPFEWTQKCDQTLHYYSNVANVVFYKHDFAFQQQSYDQH